MDNKLCRACLAPQGKVKHSSLFADNGKIANELYKLTSLVILDLTGVNCPSVICQRCLMDLERAISFRDLVIRSDDHFRESFSATANRIIENLVKEVKGGNRFEFGGGNESRKGTNIQNACQRLSETSDKSDSCTNRLQSVIKLEQYEDDSISNNQKNVDSQMTSCDSNSVSISQHIDRNSSKTNQKSTKLRQKTTKKRPNPTLIQEVPSNFDENPTNLNDFDPSSIKSEPNNDHSLERNGTKPFQDSKLPELDFKSSDNGAESTDLYQNFHNFYPNLEDAFQTEDITSINHKQVQEISRQSSKKRKISTDYSCKDLDSNKIKCHICSKTFSQKCYLTQHFQTIHMTFRAHRCRKCGKKYATVEELALHEEKHVADKPFKCAFCPKAFIHKSDLKRHEISHSVQKPFQCTICSRGFVRNDHFLKHKRIHREKSEKGSKLKRNKVENV